MDAISIHSGIGIVDFLSARARRRKTMFQKTCFQKKNENIPKDEKTKTSKNVLTEEDMFKFMKTRDAHPKIIGHGYADCKKTSSKKKF